MHYVHNYLTDKKSKLINLIMFDKSLEHISIFFNFIPSNLNSSIQEKQLQVCCCCCLCVCLPVYP